MKTTLDFFNSFFKKKKSRFKPTVQLPKTAQNTIPFIEAYDNGLFLVDENKYTLIFAFENIDYLLIRDSEQLETYNRYMKLLNALPSDIQYQEFIMNTEIDLETIRKVVIPQNDRRFSPDIYEDYCNVMKSYIDQTEDCTAHKIMLIAMSYTPETEMDNANVLFRYYRELQTYFSNMKSDTKQLMPMEIFAILHKIYHQFDKVDFLLPKDFLARGHRIKDYIAPSSFVFEPNHIRIGSSFMRIMYVAKYDRELNDTFIADLLDNKEKIIVSKHIVRMDKSAAYDMVHKKIVNMEGRIQKRKTQNHKSGTDYLPFEFMESLKELSNLQDKLSGTTCELFSVGVFIAVSARTEEELETITEFVDSKARKHQVTLMTATEQQNKALDTVLPFANSRFTGKNNCINTCVLSEEASVLIPFSTINHFSDKGICYGISTNSLTSSIITLDRTEEMNSNGFFLGTSGSGKSMFTKLEILDVLLKYPNDEIIVIDPENEYKPLVDRFNGEILKLSPSSNTYFNVFDTDLSYSEEGSNAVAMKSQFVMTMIETAKGLPLSSNEKSVIDRCVKTVYKEFLAHNGDKQYLPTLKEFYEMLLEQPEQEAHDVATSIELYVTGSFNVFAHKTNVNISKPFLVIDIFEMGEQLRSVGLQVILEYLWQRVIENKSKGKRTWIWIDEFSYFFTDGEGKETSRSGDFFAKVFKRIRKHGGTITGITQNITEVLESKQAVNMLGNAEFVVLLQQKKNDFEAVKNLFDLSETQAQFLKTGKKGSGLIICGQKIIPFEKPIPEGSQMYEICQTTHFNLKK